MIKRKRVMSALLATLLLVGCQSTSIKREHIGTVAGAVVGGLLGSQVGGGTGKAIAIAVGAATGAYLGNRIAVWMSEKDQQDLSRVSGDVLNNTKDGETITWNNPETGFNVQATPSETKQVSREVPVIRLKTVEKHPLDIMGSSFVANSSANLRSGPSTSTSVVGGLKKGENFEAIGRVVGAEHKGRGWIAVGKSGGRLVGYVWEPLVEENTDSASATTSLLATKDEINIEMAETIKEPIDLDALDIRVADNNEAIDLDNLFEQDIVVGSTSCRDIDVAVSKGDKDGTSKLSACKTPQGSWEII